MLLDLPRGREDRGGERGVLVADPAGHVQGAALGVGDDVDLEVAVEAAWLGDHVVLDELAAGIRRPRIRVCPEGQVKDHGADGTACAAGQVSRAASTRARYLPVALAGFFATWAGVPLATSSPPRLPPSGPMSTT